MALDSAHNADFVQLCCLCVTLSAIL